LEDFMRNGDDPNKLANLGLTLVVLAIASLAMGYLLANLHSDTHWPSSFRTQGSRSARATVDDWLKTFSKD
jgi:hypothetical protein